MILKIQDPGTLKWIYYDNINKISFNYNEYFVTHDCQICPKDADIIKIETKEYLDPDALYVVWSDEDDSKDAEEFQCKVVIANFRTPCEADANGKGGDYYCVAFNGRTYLLNDEGKTIERIS